MVNPLAALSVLFSLQLIVSQYTAHGGSASDVDASKSSEDGKDASSTNNATVVPEGYTAFPDIGVGFKYYDYNYTWDSARKHCVKDGGWLALIDSVEKGDHANSVVPANSPDPFVGIHRLFDQSEWVTVDYGLPLDFVPWSGDFALNDTTQLCAGSLTTGVTPFWCDIPGSHLCEVQISTQSQKPLNKTDDEPSLKSIKDIPSGYTVFPDLGVAYKYYNASITWNEARKYCITNGADLAIIDSYEKVEHVIRLKTSRSNVHVGVHRLFADDEWIDVKNDSPATAIPWRAPSYEEEASRKCMSLSTDGGNNGLFANTCDAAEAFVCEISIYEN